MTTPPRRLRADAQHNHDRLVEVAAEAFARSGSEVSMKSIAREAGVGIGTLYRRFPTREQLVWAIYRSEVDRICREVPTLLSEQPAATALRQWMHHFVGFLSRKQGMADALKAALATDDGLRLETRAMLTTALASLLEAGAEQHDLRPDAVPLDVMMALGGIALIAGEAGQEEQAGRLIELLLDGLRPRYSAVRP